MFNRLAKRQVILSAVFCIIVISVFYTSRSSNQLSSYSYSSGTTLSKITNTKDPVERLKPADSPQPDTQQQQQQ